MAGLLALFLAAGSSGESIITRAGIPYGGANSDPSIATQGPLDYYVDAAGSDSNSCTAAGASTACLTIPGATAKSLAKRIRHPVIVHVGTGTFGLGGALEGYSCEPGYSPTTGAYLKIVGELTTATCATGSCTGTADSSSAQAGTVFALLTKAGAGWTIDDLRGKLLEITGGTGAGQLYGIDSNTATTISIAGSWSVAPDATSTFAVRTWATTVASGLTLPANLATETAIAPAAAVPNYAAFIVDNIGGAAIAPSGGLQGSFSAGIQACVSIDRMSMSGRGVVIRNARGVSARFNRYTSATSPGVDVYDASIVTVQGSYSGSHNAGIPLIGTYWLSTPSTLNINGNVVDGGIGIVQAEVSTTITGQYLVTSRSNSFRNSATNGANVGVYNLGGGGEGLSIFDKFATASGGPCIQIGPNNTTWGAPGSFTFQADSISGCAGDAIRAMGPVMITAVNSGGTAVSGTGNGGYGFSLSNGAKLRINAQTTVTGTGGDILLDNVVATYAQIPASTSIAGPQGGRVATATNLDPTVFRLDQFTTAALPASAASFKGGCAWDTTLNALTCNNGAAWVPVIANFALGASSFSTAILNNTDLAASEINRAATLKSLRFTVAAAGTNGGGSTMIFSLCGAPGACATSYGSVTVNCTDPAGTVGVGTVTTAAVPAGTIANWRVTTDGCTLDPIGNMEASLTTP